MAAYSAGPQIAPFCFLLTGVLAALWKVILHSFELAYLLNCSKLYCSRCEHYARLLKGACWYLIHMSTKENLLIIYTQRRINTQIILEV